MIEDRIKIVKDELLDMKVDAIVNPTDEYFSGSDGLDKLIQKNAGEKLSKKLSKSGPCQIGQCIITKGYDLSVKSIIHTCTPKWKDGKENESYLTIGNTYYNNGKTTKERMKVMCQTNDGFIISEKDLKLRGSGDFFGTAQHGVPEFKIANLFENIQELKIVQNLATNIIQEDPNLELEKNFRLKTLIQDKFTSRIEI